jgi:hypothetical protein
VDELAVDELAVDELAVDELAVDELSSDELSSDELPVDVLPVEDAAAVDAASDAVAAVADDEPAATLADEPGSPPGSGALVLHVLLRAVRGLSPSVRERAAREAAVDRLARADVEALSDRLGISPGLARRLRDACREHVERRSASDWRSAERLLAILDDVRVRAHEFGSCDEEDRDRRRVLRHALGRALTRLELSIAERGDRSLLSDLECRSVAERIDLVARRFDPSRGTTT